MKKVKFYLGTHIPNWLWDPRLKDIPLFVSRRTLKPLNRKSRFPQAVTRWALDSGGFQELSIHGRWTVPPDVYIREVRRCREEIGSLDWAAIQDWMVEPSVRKKTGLSVEEHQLRTIISYVELTSMAPEIPWVPVLQGWELGDYLKHIEMYERANIHLRSFSVVGVGSVCRRQNTKEAAEIFNAISSQGINIHGFGVKKSGLKLAQQFMTSADSLAWSYDARISALRDGEITRYRLCGSLEDTHQNCANCLEFALMWRAKVLSTLEDREY